MGYATTFNQIYWLRAFMGFSEALYIPAGLSLISDYHTNKTRSLAIGLHMSGIYMGQALGGFGATFATMFSWQQAFHTFGFIGIAYSFILILFLKNNQKIKKNEKTPPICFKKYTWFLVFCFIKKSPLYILSFCLSNDLVKLPTL